MPRSVFRDALSSLAQVAVSALCMLLLYRYALRTMGPADFGIWALVIAATSLVGLSNMGFSGSIIKHVAEAFGEGDRQRLAQIVESSAIAVAGLSLLIALACYPLMQMYFGATLRGLASAKAVALLPTALLAFGLSMVAGIYQSALYGCERIFERNALLVFDSISYLLLCVSAAGSHGLQGFVVARAVQNALTLAASVALLKLNVPQLSALLPRLRLDALRGLAGYAAGFQAIGLLSMAMDPLTKGLLSRFGSLELVAWFEMGSRLVGQLRGLIVSANQVLVPAFARSGASLPAMRRSLFERSNATVFYLTLGLFGMLAASLPLVSLLWLGGEQPVFISVTSMLCFGWALNTLSVPAYFACLGTGALRDVFAAHVCMSLLNILLGLLLGYLHGGLGVVTAWVVSLAAGGVAIHFAFLRREGPPRLRWLPPGGGTLAGACTMGLVVAWLASRPGGPLPSPATPTTAWRAAIPVACFAAVYAVPALRHPVRRELWAWATHRGPRRAEVAIQ